MWNALLILSCLLNHASAKPAKRPLVLAPTPTITPTPTPSSISVRTLKLYEIGKTDGPLLYTQKIRKQKLANRRVSTYTSVFDPKGNLVFSETILSEGSMPLYQSDEVQQTKRFLNLEVKEERVYLRTRGLNSENDEKPAEDDEALPENLITGALAEDFILENWDALMKDETVYAKLAVMELREIIKFKFWKKQMTTKNGREVMEVMMKPSSFLVSLIVDPIHIFMDLKEKKMVHYIGRTPLWKFTNGKISALDAEIVFD
jgi:hypothetical protein